MRIINKAYLSSSKVSSPLDYTVVHDVLSNGVKCEIKQFTGGNYDVSHPDDCDMLILIPPTNNAGLANRCSVGRGQYDMAVRALKRDQPVIVFVHGTTFKIVKKSGLTEVNWSDNYGFLEYADNRISESLQYELKLRKDGIQKASVSTVVLTDNTELLALPILFPEQFKF